MAIEFHDLLSAKARKFGASEESVEFQQIVLDAGNYTLDDLENIAGVTTTRITAVNESIDLDAQLYEGTMSIGMDFYMQDLSQYAIQDLAGVEARYMRKLNTAQRLFLNVETPIGVRGDMS